MHAIAFITLAYLLISIKTITFHYSDAFSARVVRVLALFWFPLEVLMVVPLIIVGVLRWVRIAVII